MVNFESSNVFILTEESVYNAQPVANVTTNEAATFEIIAGDPHGYLHIDSATGNVTLSATGVNEINTDYPENLELEINLLEFTIEATSVGDASTDTIDLAVGVIRVHDEEPQIVEEIISPLYVEDTTDGFRLLEIRTAYDSTFTVMTNADKATVQFANIGRVTLTATGTTWIRDLIEAGTPDPKFEFSLIIVDDLNGKEIIQNYSIDILAGSAQTNIPTKNILDLVGEHLGEDIGTSLSNINIQLFEIIKERDIFVEESVSALAQAYAATSDIAQIKDTLTELNLRIDNKIDSLRQLVDNTLNAIKDDYSTGVFSEINASLTLIQNFHLLMQDELIEITAVTLKNRGDIEAYKDFLVRYIHHEDDRVSAEATAARAALQVTLENLIQSLRNDFELFRDTTYVANQTAIWTQVNLNTTNIGQHEIRLNDVDGDLFLHEGRIDALEVASGSMSSSTLEDFGDPNAWSFYPTNLSWKGNAVLSVTASALTINGGTGNISVNGTYFGNSGLECRGSVFTGTATTAKYADVAEYYSVENKIKPGTIVDFAMESQYEIKPACGIFEPVGIITTQPGYSLNTPDAEGLKYMDAIALVGRVPLEVVNVQEAKRGDYVYQDKHNPTLGRVHPNKIDGYLFGRVINIQADDCTVEIKIS